jgi:hypothetical protein
MTDVLGKFPFLPSVNITVYRKKLAQHIDESHLARNLLGVDYSREAEPK